MANILFKRGKQASLDLTAKTYEDGCFYLTTDTHRLYVGVDDGSIAPVNEGIMTVDSVNNLVNETGWNHVGKFYYAQSENVLCIYNGSKWVQINPDNNTTVAGVALSISVEDGKAQLKTTISDSEGAAVESTALDLESSQGITIEKTDTGVLFKGDKYTLNQSIDALNEQASISLSSAQGQDTGKTIVIKAGQNMTLNEDAADGSIVLNATASGEMGTLMVTPGGAGADDNKGFYIQLVDEMGAGTGAEFDPIIKIGDQSFEFVDGTADLDVYNKTEMDRLLQGLNAMTYRGVVGNTGLPQLPDEGVQIGDTYLVITNEATGMGDLAVARGTEEDGVIVSDLVWDTITFPGGAFGDTQFGLANTEHGVVLVNGTSGENVGGFALVSGASGLITMTDSENGTHGGRIVTLEHGNVTTERPNTITSTEESALKMAKCSEDYLITAVTGVETNDQGHVTKVLTKEYKVQDTNGDLSQVALEADPTGTNEVTVTTTVAYVNAVGEGDPKSDSFILKSDNLNVSVDEDTSAIGVNFEWGSF